MKTIFILLISVTCCFAQQTHKGRIIGHFNKEGKTERDPSVARSFRTVEEVGAAKYIVRDYYVADGFLQMEAECNVYTPELNYDGKVVIYHDNGKIKDETFYVDGERSGPSRTFYRNGNPKADIIYKEGKGRFNHYYSVEGNDYLVNGNGIYPDTLTSTSTQTTYREIVDREQFGSFFIENSDTIYLAVEKQAEYENGLRKLASDIGSRMKYPASARRSSIQGKVFISFTIRDDGSVTDITIVQGFHGDCDAEALRVVKTLGRWKPAEHHNKKVHSKFVLPIGFKLG